MRARGRAGLLAAARGRYKGEVPLHAETEGTPGAGRIALVHGFAQTGACWGPVAAELARDHEVVRIDAPGHGRSTEDERDLWGAAAQVAAAGGRAIYVGYSLGGRICLHLALARPELVRGLVLIGATPGIADPEERAARARADDALAARIEREGVEAFLDAWLAGPLFAGLPAAMRFTEARRGCRAAGLAASLRRAGVGQQEDLWPRLGEVRAPTLVCAGAEDAKFAAIARAMAAAIGPGAGLALIEGAGHAAHLEAPAAFLAALRGWSAAALGV